MNAGTGFEFDATIIRVITDSQISEFLAHGFSQRCGCLLGGEEVGHFAVAMHLVTLTCRRMPARTTFIRFPAQRLGDPPVFALAVSHRHSSLKKGRPVVGQPPLPSGFNAGRRESTSSQ